MPSPPTDPSGTSLPRRDPASDSPTVPVRAWPADPEGVFALETTDFEFNEREIPSSFGHYHLKGEIARGGMGAIFKGDDTDLGRTIALKVLLADHQDKENLRQRFIEEARITARLQHPGIVPVFEMGQFVDNRPFFTMGYVKGKTLAHLLAKRREPSEDLPHFLKIFEQVCQTLAYAHAVGVIHRDLKPGNVMVAAFGVVKVMDWGLAKVLGEPCGAAAGDGSARVAAAPAVPRVPEGDGLNGSAAITRTGSVVGTLAYMAPEQARGEIDRLDKRADVFGLGGILCVILTGQPPFVADDPQEVYRKAREGDLADAFARLDACGAEGELTALARRCLAAEPRDRPADAVELARAVTAYLESDLRRAERDLVRFFDLSLDLFCLAGLDGYFRRVNSNFSRVLGYTDLELRTRPFLDFVHPEDQVRTTEQMALLARGLPVVQFQNRYRDAQGRYRWFEWTCKPVPEEGVIFAVARDVTDRFHLQQRLQAAPAPPLPRIPQAE